MKEKIQVITIALLFALLSVFAWIKPAAEVSDSELRKLAQLPELSLENIISGKYMSEFESYTLDQFPFRDEFRSLKAITYLYVLGQKDNNDIYLQDGYAVKMEYPLNEASVKYAADRFNNVYDKFIKGSNANCYITIIPDKNYYLADSHGALSMDYRRLYQELQENTGFAEYIDITDLLSEEDYYKTDTHWNQTKITDVADRLSEKMGVSLNKDYKTHELSQAFYGVYYGQAALPIKPDKMEYLTNESIDNAVVFDMQNNKYIDVYNEDMMNTRSPYDLFLGGSLSFITIENDKANTDKELVVFRDSFASSIAPLLISGYRKITLIDIRYLQSDRLGSFIEFDNQDVLFMYSSLILNNSSTLK